MTIFPPVCLKYETRSSYSWAGYAWNYAVGFFCSPPFSRMTKIGYRYNDEFLSTPFPVFFQSIEKQLLPLFLSDVFYSIIKGGLEIIHSCFILMIICFIYLN